MLKLQREYRLAETKIQGRIKKKSAEPVEWSGTLPKGCSDWITKERDSIIRSDGRSPLLPSSRQRSLAQTGPHSSHAPETGRFAKIIFIHRFLYVHTKGPDRQSVPRTPFVPCAANVLPQVSGHRR